MGRKTFSEIGLLGLYTETSLHCGAESGAGYVDLPVQRERHTGYPLIPGSTVKGILRDEAKDPGGLGQERIDKIFGTADAKGPGTVSFGDGLLAAFPIRSSGAPFHWVTCPFVVERAFRLLGRKGPKIDPPVEGKAWARAAGEVVLEELRVETEALDGFDELAKKLLTALPGDDRGFEHTRGIFPDHLAVVRDEDFKELVEVGTEVVTRIKLNYLGTTETLKKDEHPGVSTEDLQGNLFVQELVPPETLFLCPLRAAEAPADLVEAFGKLPVVRFGGDETIGRGVTHLTYLPAEERSGS